MLLFQHGGEEWKSTINDCYKTTHYLHYIFSVWPAVCAAGNHASHSKEKRRQWHPLASWETPAALSPDRFDWPLEARLIGCTMRAHPTFLLLPIIIYISLGLCLWWLLISIKVKAANTWKRRDRSREEEKKSVQMVMEEDGRGHR